MGERKEISQLFNRISDRYELVNHILSFGLDIIWRKKACRKVYELNGDKKVNIFLDIATGTGEIIKHCRNSITERFVGLDPAIKMLEFAKKTVDNAFLINAAAEDIPLKDNSADIIFVSFGVRNLEDRKKAFSEFNRVLKKGSYLVILEFIHREDGGFFYKLSHLYIQKILPFIGGIITGDFKAYRYLAYSIDHFITAGMLRKEVENFGFKVEYIENFFPTVSIIIGKNEKD